ncbi:MAG TPA: ABC transporter permease subunit [Gammaproteobacteria bacterium]
MSLLIAGRELRSLFIPPLAWSILGVVQGILAWVYLVQLDNFITLQARLSTLEGAPGVTDMIVMPLFSLLGILLLLVMPLITMRLISEERRNKTLPLFLSSPAPVKDIVIGKFLAVLGFVGVMLALLILMSLAMALGTSLDYGQVAAGLLGLFLMLAAFAAIGLYISCLTQHPTVAAVVTFGVLFMLWIVNWATQAGAETDTALRWLSIVQHQESFYRGLVDTADIFYYLLIIGLFLLLSVRRLDAERLQT